MRLPQQEVVCISAGQRPSQLPGVALQASAEHLQTGQVKIPLVWDKGSLALQRADAGRHLWRLSAGFRAEVPCELAAHFHCRGRVGAAGLEYTAAAQGGPPSFKQSFAAGTNFVVLEGERAIDLQKWPLEVFWKYKQRNADVFPIVFSLSAGNVQSVMHLTLEVPSRSGGKTASRDKEPRCVLLQQKVVVSGKEYTLQEIYGLAELGRDDKHDESAVGEPCVICLSEPRNTAIKPCRHLCVCEECAGRLQAGAALRNDHCPICRGPIEGMQVFDVNH